MVASSNHRLLIGLLLACAVLLCVVLIPNEKGSNLERSLVRQRAPSFSRIARRFSTCSPLRFDRARAESDLQIARLQGGTKVKSSGIPDPEDTENFESNITPTVEEKVGVHLHLQDHHPLNIIKNKIEKYFEEIGGGVFKSFDKLPPYVSTQACFDDVLVPKDHVSRKISDTYYKDPVTVLRTHTSAHQTELLRKGERAFLVTGDCFRRDEIDASHYPVFHQMEGVRVFNPKEVKGLTNEMVVKELKTTLEGMVKTLFGDVEMRWVDAYFPFTHDSMELEIFFNGDWLEVLGCGVMQEAILQSSELGPGNGEHLAWAFGMGLERLAMVLFEIPDIRLFWSKDARFLSQFKDGQITK
eukprot:88025-Amorphochlora_amoeboformis.AAC.1